MNIRMIYCTTGTREEAEKIGDTLISSRLAACVNISSGITSIYRWEGKIQKDGECSFLAKTTEEKMQACMEKIRELHTYKIPCIVAIPILDGNPDFLKWIEGETR